MDGLYCMAQITILRVKRHQLYHVMYTVVGLEEVVEGLDIQGLLGLPAMLRIQEQPVIQDIPATQGQQGQQGLQERLVLQVT